MQHSTHPGFPQPLSDSGHHRGRYQSAAGCLHKLENQAELRKLQIAADRAILHLISTVCICMHSCCRSIGAEILEAVLVQQVGGRQNVRSWPETGKFEIYTIRLTVCAGWQDLGHFEAEKTPCTGQKAPCQWVCRVVDLQEWVGLNPDCQMPKQSSTE